MSETRRSNRSNVARQDVEEPWSTSTFLVPLNSKGSTKKNHQSGCEYVFYNFAVTCCMCSHHCTKMVSVTSHNCFLDETSLCDFIGTTVQSVRTLSFMLHILTRKRFLSTKRMNN